MALEFIDGFDHYATNDITKKWDTNNGGVIDNTNPRRSGTKHLKFSAITHYVVKNVTWSQTYVIGFAYKSDDLSNNNGITFKVNTTTQLYFKFVSSGAIEAYRGATFLKSSGSGVLTVDTWQYIEIKVYIHDTAGTYEVKVNGVSVLSDSGIDTKPTADGGVNSIFCYGSNGSYTYYDDLYMDTANFKGDCRIDTLMPNGAGNYTQWDPSAGSNYQCVDDSGDINDDTDYCSTSIVDEIDTYTFENLSALGVTIHGLACNVCARKDDASTRKFKALTRVNGSDYVGDEETLNDNYHVHQYIWQNNPDDAAAWEEADVNGAEFGAKLTV